MTEHALLTLHQLLEEVRDLHLDRLFATEEHVCDQVVQKRQLRGLLLLAEHKLGDILQRHVGRHVEGYDDLETADFHQIDPHHATLGLVTVPFLRLLKQLLDDGNVIVANLPDVLSLTIREVVDEGLRLFRQVRLQ